MKGSKNEKNPQVGPGQAGESHGAPGGASRPDVCGGANFCKAERVRRRRKESDSTDVGEHSCSATRLAADLARKEEKRKAKKAKEKVDWEADLRKQGFHEEDIRKIVDVTDTSDLSRESSRASSACHVPGRKRRVAELDSDDTTEEAASPAPQFAKPVQLAKRGRGRPPTTGQYAGLAQAKRDYARACEEAEMVEASADVEERAQRVLGARDQFRAKLNSGAINVATLPRGELDAVIADCLGLVSHVEQQSKNLQGRMRNALKVSVSFLREAFATVQGRTEAEELGLLRGRNSALEREVADLRQRVEALAKTQQLPAAPTHPPPVSDLVEEVTRGVITAVGHLVDARLAGLEDRLPPSPRLRPELAHERRVQAATPSPRKAATAPASSPPAPPPAAPGPREAGKKKKKKKKRKAKPTMAAAEAGASRSAAPAAGAATSAWQLAGKRRGGAREKPAPKPKPPRKKRKRVRIRAPPKTAAVAYDLLPAGKESGKSWDSILDEAKLRVDLASLGIEEMRFREAACGARLLEIPGPDGAAKADALAEQLREIWDPAAVRVRRPMKMALIRLLGLNDAAKAADVMQVVADVGACARDHVRVGRISQGRSVIVTCPVAAARKLVAARKVRVGWTTARVEAVAPRPPRCFKCMGLGHFGKGCPSGVDLNGSCFRCGKPGHMARECDRPLCTICKAAGLPDAHRVGEDEWCPGRPKGRAGGRPRRGKSAAGPRARGAPQAQAQEAMDAAPAE